MPAPRPVITFGEILVDLIAPRGTNLLTGDTLHIRDGGAPANVSVALARLGVPVQLRSVIGDDPFGQRLRERVEREGVDVTRMRVADGEPTTIALAWSDERGDGQFRLLRNADRLLNAEDADAETIADAEAIVVGSVAMCAEPSMSAILAAISHALAARVPIVVDLNIRPGQIPMDELRLRVSALLSSASVLKLSVDDALHMWGSTTIEEAAQRVRKYAPDIAVITDGSRGAAMLVGDDLQALPVFQVDAVEPTGAGDAFTAAFISRMMARQWSGAGIDDLRFAMAAGALATTRPGAMDGLPSQHDVEAFLSAIR